MCEVVLRRTCGVAVRIVAWNCWIENEVRVHRSTYKDSVGGRAKRSMDGHLQLSCPGLWSRLTRPLHCRESLTESLTASTPAVFPLSACHGGVERASSPARHVRRLSVR